MRLSTAGEYACAVMFLVSALMHSAADSRSERQIAMGVGILAIVGFFASSRLKGWVGASYQEMDAERVRLEALAERWVRPDGSVVDPEERGKILVRLDKLYAAMQQHPDRPARPR